MSITEKVPLSLPRSLKEELILYRVRTGMAARKPVVASASVQEVERALEIAFPRELVAVFAATGRDPYEMVVLTEEAREEDGLPNHFVAVSLEPREDEARVPVYWCLDCKKAARGSTEMIRWAVDPSERRYGLSMADFIHSCFGGAQATEGESAAVRGLLSKFRPMMVGEPRTSFRRVIHPRFGSGFVLRDFNDGNHKVEVEFPRVGIKVLLASYVQDAPARLAGRQRRAERATRRAP